jgi:formate hydrogenlyase transcriptional activator
MSERQEAVPLGQDRELQLRRETKQLQLVMDVAKLLSSSRDIVQVFPTISAYIRRLFRQEFASVALHDAATGLLVHGAVDFPLRKGFFSTPEVSDANSPAARAMRMRAPMIFSKQELQSFQSEVARHFVAEGLQSLCCVPLLRPKKPLGVLVLGSTRHDAFPPETLHLAAHLALQLAIALENQRAAAEIETLKLRLDGEQEDLAVDAHPQGMFAEIVGESPILARVLQEGATVAPTEATVLILGETGTGKELVARAIHRMSRRKEGAFIKVNCAAIPTGLLESELFGHEKGAFTGAINRKIGRMELAEGGTLFLDEIGEIQLELQPKLLRVLQDHEFERLGSTQTTKVDVRLIAATNCDLEESIANHQFRSDLFYRLSVFPIHMPPLRERRDDIPLLVRHFVSKFALHAGRSIDAIPKETMAALMNWHWPGNVRELENLIERSMILSQGSVLRVPLPELRARKGGQRRDNTLHGAEREHIVRALVEAGGALSGPQGAARRLGLKRTTLQSKMKRLQITREDYT